MPKLAAFAATIAAVAIAAGGAPTNVHASDYFNGFEADVSGWDVFGGAFDATRVPSGGGTLGVTSASGSWHAESGTAAGNWGGYGDNDGCASVACAAAAFPANGYNTAVDIYLDVDAGFANDTRFDFSSAINEAAPSGLHRRDFIFGCGFYDDNDGPGASTDRFICTASNNAPGWPKNPAREPTVIASTTGWYTFLHEFRDDGSGVLTVDLSVLSSSGTVIKTWTLSDATDVIGTTVGGNRYGWFVTNGFTTLAFDNARRNSFGPSLACVGFEPPMDRTVTARRKNRVLPLKMVLVDGSDIEMTDLDITAAPVVEVDIDSGPVLEPGEDELLSTGKGDDGNQFVFSGSSWDFNLKTSNFSGSGTYTITAESGDPSEYIIDPTCTATFVIP